MLPRAPSWLLADIEKGRQLGATFRKEVLEKNALAWDAQAAKYPLAVPQELLNEMNQRKFLRLWIPRALGGGGLSPLSYFAWSEEAARGCLGAANILGAHYFALGLISATDNLALLKRLVREIKEGEHTGKPCFFSAAVTESGAGTDLEDPALIAQAQVCTRLHKENDWYILDGSKQFISNASFATWFVVTAFEDLKKPRDSVAILAVNKSTPGLRVGPPEKKWGQNICPASPVYFENCIVLGENIAMNREQFAGQKIFSQAAENVLLDSLSLSRVGVAMMAAGAMQGALDLTFDEISRDSNPKRIESESVQAAIARLLGAVETWRERTRSLAEDICLSGPGRDLFSSWFHYAEKFRLSVLLSWTAGIFGKFVRESLRKRRGEFSFQDRKNFSAQGSLVKAGATEALQKNLTTSFELLGQRAARRGHNLEKILRDGKLLQIYEGVNLINHMNAFNMLLGERLADFTPFADPAKPSDNFGPSSGIFH